MQRNIQWKGVYPTLTTKFHTDGQLDIPSFLKNTDTQIEADIKGIIIGGSLGEISTITPQERIELLIACLKHCGEKIDILINLAEGATHNVIHLAQAAQENGADGIMLLPPMMYRPTNKEVVQSFTDVAKSIDLPILRSIL